jgi:hypothetical protein
MKKPRKQAKAASKSVPSKPTKPIASRVRVKVPRMGTTRPGKPNEIGWHPVFLGILANPENRTNVAAACRAVCIDNTTAYDHRKRFPDFSAAWDDAIEMALNDLEGGLVHRCIYGLKRKKFTKSGEPIYDPDTGKQYFEMEYNSTEVLRVLAAKRPEVWSEKRQLELSGKFTMTDEEITAASTDTKESLLLTLAGGLKGKKP